MPTDRAATTIKEMKRRPTIYDVAREAGVAASTVSRAYSRPGRVNAETGEELTRTGTWGEVRASIPAGAWTLLP